MKKKLTLLIFLFPVLLMGQASISNNGTISIDFGKKKKQQQDTVQQQTVPGDEDAAPASKKQRKQTVQKADSSEKLQAPDYRKEGLFKALFTVGASGCQIDGDGYAGYNYLGLEAGVGALLRVQKILSVSMYIDYSMKGAKQAFIFNADPTSLQLYRVEVDYMTIPVSLNFHQKNLLMVSVGLAPGFLVRYSQRDEDGYDVTSNPPEGQPPKTVDLQAFGGIYFIIKRHFMLGGKFAYSTYKMRGPDSNGTGITRLAGEFNNDITISFTYILDMVKKRKNIN